MPPHRGKERGVKALGSSMDATREDHTSEVSQTEKDKYHRVSLRGEI